MNGYLTRIGRTLLKGILPFMLLPFLSACADDEHLPAPKPSGDDALVTIAIQVPGGTAPATRALSVKDENAVETIEVLVFEKGGNYKYTAYSTDIENVGGNHAEKKFTVKLIKGEWDLVVLANSRAMLKDAFPNGISEGETRANIANAVVAEMNDKWGTDSEATSGYRDIPMWGDRAGVKVEGNLVLEGDKGVKLARMLARVDVSLSIEAQDNFELEEIYLYNYNTQGTLIPLSGWSESESIAKAPNVPAGSTLLTDSPFLFDKGEITEEGIASRGEIYLFESEEGDVDNLDKNTCLVLGGIYDGKTNYYRVDFANNVGEKIEYLPILRNHRYLVEVQYVTGPGFETPKEAFDSRPVNIEVGVLPWNEREMSDVVFDGQNYLSVSRGVVELSRTSYTREDDESNQIIIKTDYTDRDEAEKSGWKIVAITEEDGETKLVGDWISVDSKFMKGDPNVAVTVPLIVKENDRGEERTGLVHIKAGRLEYRVKVVQSNVLQPTLAILVKQGDAWVETSQIRFMQEDDKNPPKQRLTR